MIRDMTREQALALDNDPNWKALRAELDKVIAAETEHLLVCPAEDMFRLQERVKAFRLCTRLPGIVAEREEI